MTGTYLNEISPNQNPKSSSKFLRYIHNFRGFAILTIVATHIIASLQWRNETIEKLTYILIGNGTVYFVFIAGFLFQFLSSKYEYKKYLNKKLQYVILPYLFLSIPAIKLCLIEKIYTPPDWFQHHFSDWSIPGQILMYLLTGAHLPPFWFIPMITIFYLISPILIWVDRHPKNYWILPILLGITAIIPRAQYNANPIQSFVHFLSVYMIGMFCSHYRDKIFSILKRKYFWLLIGFVILTILEFTITPRPTAINSWSKLILCVLIIYCLWLFELKLPKQFHDVMGFLAELSFGIYFLHGYFIIAYSGAANKFGFNQFWTQANPLTFSLIFLLSVGASIVSLLIIKNIFGKKSRFIVGS
ncbi:acyltransferase [Chlorogloeopsis sp. ULAP02]|uniref:acyltransferase n=1 Tax=Chlorogloeopsis sp. ULAP02 TaxID=3107926 RepID=UPI003136703A